MISKLKTTRWLLVLVQGGILTACLWVLPGSRFNWNRIVGPGLIPNNPSMSLRRLKDTSFRQEKTFQENFSWLASQSNSQAALNDPVTKKSNIIHMQSNKWTGAKSNIDEPSKVFPTMFVDVSQATKPSRVAVQNFRRDRPLEVMIPTQPATWTPKSLSKSSIPMDVGTLALAHLNNHLKEVDRELKLDKHVVHSSNTYLSIIFTGRLGNQMFEFASLLGIARLQGVTPAIPKDSELAKVFNINLAELDFKLVSNFSHVGQERDCAFDPIKGNFTRNQTLVGYFQSWRYFSHVYEELRKQFTFKNDIVKHARLAIETSINSQHPHFSRENITFVGVHIRRGDILKPQFIQFGYAVGSKDYLFRAMEHFLSKYKAVMFIVCSNDMEWAMETLPHQFTTFITGQEAEVDMAILSLCNHTIMTVGSYGWWSAWLAGGTTIYQIQQTIPGTDLDKRFDLTDYMLTEWIGMDETIMKPT